MKKNSAAQCLVPAQADDKIPYEVLVQENISMKNEIKVLKEEKDC